MSLYGLPKAGSVAIALRHSSIASSSRPGERVRPAAERVRLGGRPRLERAREERDRLLELAREQPRRALPPELERAIGSFVHAGLDYPPGLQSPAVLILSDDRKYRHRGYQDSGSDSDSGPRPRGPAPAPQARAPRGRGVDQDKAVVFRCKHCGEKVARPRLDRRRGDLPQVRRRAARCSQCANFDTSARFECTQPIPERIASKQAANTCTFYAPAKTFDLTGSRGVGATPDDARAAFDTLFKK